MNKLTEKEVIKLMKEEWNKRLALLSEGKDDDALKMNAMINGKSKMVISPDLKVEKEDLLYTVVSANDKEVTLKKPDGNEFTITAQEFEKEFERE